MTKSVFIDGLAGTTGLQIHSRLSTRSDIDLIEIDYDSRKNLNKRKQAINSSEVVILCLPDEAARDAVNLVESESVRVLDASSAHRVTDGWVYGLPEISKTQSEDILNAKLVSNPGCYPTGAILLLRPLIDKGLLDMNYAYVVSAVSGYSGGGKQTIERFENTNHPEHIESSTRRYALHHEHKHIEEMKEYSRLDRKPVFMPSYGRYRQGIILQIPVHCNLHTAKPTADMLRDTLASCYSASDFISVIGKQQTFQLDGVDPEMHNNSNNISLFVFEPQGTDHVVLCAIYDNLGKGASGAAVQNLEIMLELKQSSGNV